MNTNRFGLTPDELEDEAKHFYAVGTLRLRAMADEISEIAPTVDSKFVLKLLQVQLVDVHQLIVCQTIDGMDDPDTYSDGTPVSIVVGPPSSRDWSAPTMWTSAASRGCPTAQATTTTTTTGMGPFLPAAR
jgi:hypothetical protein